MTRDLEEYTALRATIRERGTARISIFVLGLTAWCGLTIATTALAPLPIATLAPLLVLAGVFEAVLSLHVGVERLGRYLQVFHEGVDRDQLPAPPEGRAPGNWEQTAMAYGRAFPGSGSDPLFAAYFIAAALLNFVPVLLAGPVAIEVGVMGSVHLLFAVRVLLARRGSSRQRDADLERFERLRNG